MSCNMKKLSGLRPKDGVSSRECGFSLLEVLVALLVISISLLGVAGMQALSISNTGESGFRSIAATQAASLAAAMSANEGFWQVGVAPGPFTISGGTVNGVAASTFLNCSSYGTSPTACSPSNMATYDMSQWGTQLASALPSGAAVVTCNFATLDICQIQVTWVEKNLAQNQSLATAGGSSYHLDVMVQP